MNTNNNIVKLFLLFVNFLFVGKPTKSVSCVDVRVTVPLETKNKKRKPAGGRWKQLAGDSQHARVNPLEVEPNRQQPVGGSRKPAGASQQG